MTSIGLRCRDEQIALFVIIVSAVAFRLVRLGALSFSGDEETTTLALLDGWPPQLPGGLIYLRGLRLVPALAAGPRVAAAWWLARSFLGPRRPRE